MGWERIGRKPRSLVEPDEMVVKLVGKDKQSLTIMMGLDLAHRAGFEGCKEDDITVDLVIGTDRHIGLYKLCKDERGASLIWKGNRVDYKTSRVPKSFHKLKQRPTEIISCGQGEIVFKVDAC